MHTQIVRGLRIRNAALLDQPHRLKLELPRKLPSLHDTPPVPSKHLTRCLRNRVQASRIRRVGRGIYQRKIQAPEEDHHDTTTDIGTETPRKMDELEEALRAHESTIERFPTNVVAYNGRAEVLREMGRFEDALTASEMTLARFPHDIVARIGYAETLRGMRRLEEALKVYEATIETFPDSDLARTGRAELLREMGRAVEALTPPSAGAIPSPERRAVRFDGEQTVQLTLLRRRRRASIWKTKPLAVRTMLNCVQRQQILDHLAPIA